MLDGKLTVFTREFEEAWGDWTRLGDFDGPGML